MKIGFIGQGWIGKNYADSFEERGYEVVRYALEEPYVHNAPQLLECEIVFVAVPTPTTPQGFSYAIVEESLARVGAGATVVIKSTILPGTTEALHIKYPHLFVMHSPEFLREVHAAHDALHPTRNIIGIPIKDDTWLKKAEAVLAVLPSAPYSKIMSSHEAELVKYIGNCFLYEKVVFFNQVYDMASALGLDYEVIREAVSKDDRIGESHTKVLHASGHTQDIFGRGAGGHCFVKDFEAFIQLYKQQLPNDARGIEVLESLRNKNIEFLVKSNKDIDIVQHVVGDISQFT